MCSLHIVFVLIIVLLNLITVAAQEGPGIVIAHPGQDVELLCNVTRTSTNEVVGWVVNLVGPYGISALRGGILTGYNGILGSNDLIVENIMMNDGRNNSEYICVITLQGETARLRESDPTILYIAGTYISITVRIYLHNYVCIKSLHVCTYVL